VGEREREFEGARVSVRRGESESECSKGRERERVFEGARARARVQRSESGCSKERERVFERERMFKCSKVRGVLSTEILSSIEFLSIWHDFECRVAQSEATSG
jgi:hypothetical protein